MMYLFCPLKFRWGYNTSSRKLTTGQITIYRTLIIVPVSAW